MKKLGLAAILIAGSMFAASLDKSSNDELYGMIGAADAKTLSEVSFEIHKRVGKLNSEAASVKDGFRKEMRKKMTGMSDEDRVKFMQEYKGLIKDKVDSLSVKEAREMGFLSGHKFSQNGFKKDGCQDGGFHKFKDADKYRHMGHGHGYGHGRNMRHGDCGLNPAPCPNSQK